MGRVLFHFGRKLLRLRFLSPLGTIHVKRRKAGCSIQIQEEDMLQYKWNGKAAEFPWFCNNGFGGIIPVEDDGTEAPPLPPVLFKNVSLLWRMKFIRQTAESFILLDFWSYRSQFILNEYHKHNHWRPLVYKTGRIRARPNSQNHRLPLEWGRQLRLELSQI